MTARSDPVGADRPASTGSTGEPAFVEIRDAPPAEVVVLIGSRDGAGATGDESTPRPIGTGLR